MMLENIYRKTEKNEALSFFDLVRKDIESRPRPNLFSTLHFLFITCTTPLIFIYRIIPSQFAESSDWTRYWLNILVTVVTLEALINFFCVRTKDKPEAGKTLWEIDRPADVTLHPGYCEKCKLVAPENSKTHHCKVCKRCVLRRDHHCGMVGTCIGYYNQRYFAVLTFYVAIGSGAGFYYFRRHLLFFIAGRESFTWWDYFLPVTFGKTVQGQVDLVEFLMVLYCYIFVVTFLMGIGFFGMQMAIIFSGLTLHDFKKDKPRRPNTTISENFREVFGPCWIANFIIPMQLVFKQKEFSMPVITNNESMPAGHIV